MKAILLAVLALILCADQGEGSRFATRQRIVVCFKVREAS